MNSFELGRVEKTSCAQPTRRKVIAVLSAPQTKINGRTNRTERTIAGGNPSHRLRLTETRLRVYDGNQARFVAILSGRYPRDELHGLNGLGGNLVRVDAALLIRDWLIID